ncbi:MAG: sulfatase [Provencibacterium sp.]|jgi:arylsulfatase A-like enzyme|nr:sulfatase [Provencibacterium sp.]
MRTILFLSDSVNRRMLQIYAESGLYLPNLERLRQHSVVFENHWTASAPCMPARRDIMTGRLNFLERGWGPIEPFDDTLPQLLRDQGVSSHMITDHYHYLEIGGENYCQMFDQWELVRGQEWDPCLFPSGNYEPEHVGKWHPQYARNRELFYRNEENYPSAITIDKAARWLRENRDRDNFLLWVEPFDPHEPFEVPQKYLDRVGDDYTGTLYLWPNYAQTDGDEERLRHIRKRYLALLLMTDEHLGGVLDVMDAYHMWDDTAFLYTTDHGYMLGEHNFMAKNYMPAYNEVFHIPLLVHLPGDAHAGERVSALTQNIDLLPTIMELHGLERPKEAHPIHGESLIPLIEKTGKGRECALYGYFGKAINITDGRYTYLRAARGDNTPLYMYTAVPIDNKIYFNRAHVKDIGSIETGRFLPWTDYPIYRIPAQMIQNRPGYELDYNRFLPWDKEDYLFDLQEDYTQARNLVEERPEVVERLKKAMAGEIRRQQAPLDHLERLDLKDL